MSQMDETDGDQFGDWHVKYLINQNCHLLLEFPFAKQEDEQVTKIQRKKKRSRISVGNNFN